MKEKITKKFEASFKVVIGQTKIEIYLETSIPILIALLGFAIPQSIKTFLSHSMFSF